MKRTLKTLAIVTVSFTLGELLMNYRMTRAIAPDTTLGGWGATQLRLVRQEYNNFYENGLIEGVKNAF